MPPSPVSPRLFNVHASAAGPGEPHLQPGNHLRFTHHPLLGLPRAPFLVWRAVTASIKGMADRTDAVWTDADDRILQPPFDVRPGNPVTARLALEPGETCVWAEVVARPRRTGDEPDRPFPPFPRPRPRPRPPIGPGPGIRIPGVSDRLRLGRLGSILGQRRRRLRVEARVESALGPTVTAARLEPRYAFSAPGIVELTVEGTGRVTGVRWAETASFERLRFQPWRAVGLPHPGGPRYLGLAGAESRAKQRVQEAAPKRLPLQESQGITVPQSAPTATPADEIKRVESLADPLGPDLDALIHELSEPQQWLTASESIQDGGGTTVGDAQIPLLSRILQSSLDPGVAEYLGYATVDRDFVETGNRVVVYLVQGWWEEPPAKLVRGSEVGDAVLRLLDGLPAGARFEDPNAVRSDLEELLENLEEPNIGPDNPEALRGQGFLKMGALAVADRRAPPLPPEAPTIDGAVHVDWVPAPPNRDAVREVRLDVSGARVGGLLAAEKRQPPVAPSQTLHQTNDDGFRLPLTLGLNPDDEEETRPPVPGQGILGDREAAAGEVRYSLAQQDRFGRWSGPARTTVPPGPRPAPPRPVFQAFYTAPEIADPMPAGEVLVKVQVPKPESLAPGGRPVEHFRLEVTDPETGTTTSLTETVASPATPPAELSFTFGGPIVPTLSPTERRKLRLVARWEDTTGTPSVDSEPTVLTLQDPRPPSQIAVPPELQYGARPDVQGRSLVEHTWTPQAGQAGFAVHYTDENRLRGFLEDEATAGSDAESALNALDAADDAAARAQVYRNHAHLFKGHLFERLEGVVEDAGGGDLRFRHHLSASLRVLSFYRIAAESPVGARVALESLPLLAFAVPNSEPPARPTLAIEPLTASSNAGPYEVEAEVRLLPGMTEAETFRLRRSSLSAGDPMQMPVVGTGSMNPPSSDDGYQRGTLVDSGPLVIAPGEELSPWVRYIWVAEVRGAPEPGSAASPSPPVQGRWSPASDPVSLALVPPDPPAQPTGASAEGVEASTGEFEDVEITFDHPRTLNGGSFGSYRLQVYRRRPDDDAATMLGEDRISGDGPFTVSGMVDDDPADRAPSGTTWHLVLLDPIGRASDPVSVTGITSVTPT